MTTSEKPNRPPLLRMSSEAMIGLGITIGALGLLGLLLGWAQQMRELPHWASVWFVLGALLAIIGILIAILGKARRPPR